MRAPTRLTPELVLRAYAEGLFPMAEARDDPTLYWISPDARGIIPLDGLHVSHRLARTVRSERFTVTTDADFPAVIAGCAAPAEGRSETWINPEIEDLYVELFRRGHAHSLECWQNGELAGGLYGVQLGGAFFGESMFSRVRDASKVALVHLVARLKAGGFSLLDTQFITPHLASLGAIEIPRGRYQDLLDDALTRSGVWLRHCPAPGGRTTFPSFAPLSGETGLTGVVGGTGGPSWPGWLVLQLITQTS
ncbi:MAG: leucyl/phenylalanyl-tRNA--protein transferase [Alphaproteobacteria bacterium]|nr:leucyl/phenylalanyl-tRNA--protein transferase [Alphaproteobacteria bacterium]